MKKINNQLMYIKSGYISFNRIDDSISFINWDRLTKLIPSDIMKYEFIESGDTEESTSVFVFRLLKDGNPPIILNNEISTEILKIIGSPRAISFFEELTGNKNLFIRRAQIHILPKGGHVGYHIDSESSPFYKTAVVFQIKRADKGGEFVIYPKANNITSLSSFDVLVTDAELPHEVQKVVSGDRISLVFWLADT